MGGLEPLTNNESAGMAQHEQPGRAQAWQDWHCTSFTMLTSAQIEASGQVHRDVLDIRKPLYSLLVT